MRNRLHPQEIVKETPESSVASGKSTPTLDGHATPAGTVHTDGSANGSVVGNAEDQFPAGISGPGIDESIVGPLTEHTCGGHSHGEAEQSSASQSGPILGYKSLRDMHRYIMFEILVLFILSIITMTLWITWFGQGALKGHRDSDVIPTYTTSFITTITKIVQEPTVETRYHTLTSTYVSTKTTTSADIRTITKTTTSIDTRTITKTRISTTTVSATKLARWARGSSPIVQCYHGNAPTSYYNFISRRKKLQRQEALWDCLDNSKNGMRWRGGRCGGARWEVEVDPNSGGMYSDSKKCWRRCEKCVSGAIKKVLDEAECVVEDRGSRCVARYTEL